MLLSAFSVTAFSAEENAFQWKGAMNFNDSNNYITDISSIPAPNKCEMKWSYPLNITVDSGGAYYAGQWAVIDDFIYATGGGKLHKIDINNGEGYVINQSAGSTVNYYDYLCVGDGVIFVATQTSVEAYDTEGRLLGSVEGNFGYYHPVIYKDGYIICNGYIFKTEKDNGNLSFVAIGEGSIGGDSFNWSGGVFVNDLYYTVSKTTVYAVDYKTNTVVHSFTFDPSRTATNNVQGAPSYDEAGKRLYWATYTYNNFIHSVKINEADGRIDEESYISEDASQKSVSTPIIYNGRVYLAGQQGRIDVLNSETLLPVYNNVILGGGRVQGIPILSCADGEVNIYAQCYNGHLYKFTDNGDSGSAVKLAQTENYTKVSYPYGGYEHISMDNKGNIYCYNESGYLFCFGESACEVPVFTTNLSESTVKYGAGAEAESLKVEASVSEGELSYQWQISTDKENWTDITGAVLNEYTPLTNETGTKYYRCEVTNTYDGNTAKATSLCANILVKYLSSETEMNVLAGSSNSLTGGTRTEGEKGADGVYYIKNRTVKVTNLWLGVSDSGKIKALEVLQGAGNTEPKKYSVSNNDNYSVRFYKNPYTLPLVAKATAVAEDGITEKETYIVVSEGEPQKYIVSAKIEEGDEIRFTEESQTLQLSAVPDETIGEGEVQSVNWKWESSDPKVATVDETGLVKNIGGGEAYITASFENIKATVKIISETEAHNIHSYSDKVCSVCGTKEPDAVSAYFTFIDKNNEIYISKDGETPLNKLAVSVSDADCDGTVTINDGFILMHKEHSLNGVADFVTEESSYGLFVTKFMGVSDSSMAYMLNNSIPLSLTSELGKNDSVVTYFYRDLINYSDVYTFIEGQTTLAAKNETVFKLNGLSSSGEVIPNGADIKVYKNDGTEISEMATKVNGEGNFILNFEEAGEYTLKATGTASYKGQIWDNGYVEKELTDSPVVLSTMDIKVIPFTEKTVYVSIATKSGKFAVNKNGDDMWRFRVTASDTPSEPDGVVTLMEVLADAHEKYHPDGLAALSQASFITRLWGENNNGNCSYYFNDVYMTGSGTKTGTNGREWQDKLLNTVVEDGDSFYIYSFQTTDWSKGDLYTYFVPVSETAIAGREKTFFVKNGGNSPNKIANSLVKVRNSLGEELTEMATYTGENGEITLNFPTAGEYTVEISTNGTNYVTPSKLIVQVSKGNSGGGISEDNKVYISVKAPGIKTLKNKTSYEISENETPYSLLLKTGLDVEANTDNQFGGVYIEAIEDLTEFGYGPTSGWTYKVNGEYPECSSSLYALSEGDYVEWIYKKDNSGYISGGGGSSSSKKENEKESENVFTDKTFPDVSSDDWYYKSVKYVYENNLLKGTEKGFEPESSMTRGMLVTVLWRMEKEPSIKEAASFDDVSENEWYSDAVNWAVNKKIASGMGDNIFGINTPVTREQMITMLYRYSMSKGIYNNPKSKIDILTFRDVSEISDYAFLPFDWAVSSGLIKGKGEGNLCPKAALTRGEIAEILMRFCEGISK